MTNASDELNEYLSRKGEDMSWGDVVLSSFKNLPKSAYNFGADIINAVINPIDTAKTMGNIALGAAEQIPGVSQLTGQGYDVAGQSPRSAEFDATVDFFKDRYGSTEGFKKAIAEDPVGVIADLSTVVLGVGGVARGAGATATNVNRLRSVGQAVEKGGKALQKAGGYMEPTNLIKQGARLLPAQRMYESAVKWNTASRKPGRTGLEVREALTKTALDEKIMPTYRGLNKLRAKLDSLDEVLDTLVVEPTMRGETIPAEKLLKHFKELERQVWRTSGKPVSALNEVKKIRKEFERVHGIYRNPTTGYVDHPQFREPGAKKPKGDLIGFEPMTPEEVQRKKTGIYRDLEASYEKVMSSPASVKAQKAIARGAKDALAELIPEIAKVNKKYGPLKELYKALDQKAGRISNYDLLPAAVTWKGGAGYAITGGTAGGALAGVTLGILDTPLVKAKLAILIRSMQKRGINIKPTDAAIALGLFQTGREKVVENDG